MQRSELDFEGAIDEPQHDVAWPDSPEPDSPEERGDRFGIMTAAFVLCIGLFIAAIWFLNRPGFEKCSTLENVAERNACYDKLRKDLFQPPAKGPDIPKP